MGLQQTVPGRLSGGRDRHVKARSAFWFRFESDELDGKVGCPVAVRLCCYCLGFDGCRLRARREGKLDKRQQKASQHKGVACFYVKVLRTHTDTFPSDE